MNLAARLRVAVALVAAAVFAAACSTDRSEGEALESDPIADATAAESDASEPSSGSQDRTAEAAVDEDRSEQPSGADESPSSGTGLGTDEPSADAEVDDSESAGADSVEATVGEGAGAASRRRSENVSGVDCPLGLQGPRLECFLVTVPIDRDDPSLGTIDISVTLLGGRGDESLPPMAVLQGGPGGASTELAAFLPAQAFAQVFIDQRGTGFGSTDFGCPEVYRVFPEVLAATAEEALVIETEAYDRCADRLAEDPALVHTTTHAHAVDVADVMRSLGYGRWILYGVSYGTTIALEVVRDAPASLVGAVLDGVFPPTLDLDADLASAAERVLAEMDEACAVSVSCGAILAEAAGVEDSTFAGLVSEMIARLNAEPITVALSPFETSLGEALDVWIDGDSAASVLYQVLYLDEFLPLVPALVGGLVASDELATRIFTILGVELGAYSLSANALGTYFVVTCADRLPFASGPSDAMGDFAAAIVGEGLARGCGSWSVPPSPASVSEPVVSDLPVLLLSGRFDPITPPTFAAAAAEHLSAATLVVRDGRTHGVWVVDSCVDRIVEEFVADSGSSVDTSCASEERPLRWQPLR